MKIYFVRALVSFGFGIAALAGVAAQSQAAIVCEEVFACHEEYRINEDGFLAHVTVCEPTYECYDDGNGPNTGGKPKCVTDKITKQKICVMP
ncbi:MAG: hypothetical protein HUU55_01640 [Myxococcales bacterium]|nr:hypothetical protein [Myxococcales bacterium]